MTKDRITIQDILDELDLAVLELPESSIREELEAEGLDYDQVTQSGMRHLEALIRKHKRESWMDQAQRQVTSMKANLADRTAKALLMAHQWIDAGRPLPQGAFAGRQGTEISDEERLSMFRDLAMAELLEEADDEG